MTAEKNNNEISIATYTAADLPEILALFYNIVHHVCQQHYTTEQLNVWAPLEQDTALWQKRLADAHTIVARQKTGPLLAFASIDDTGYLDYLYVHQDYQRQGIAQKLYTHLEHYARQKGAQTLTAEVSLTAQGFFLKQGFTIKQEQQVERQGIKLTNFVMEKELSER